MEKDNNSIYHTYIRLRNEITAEIKLFGDFSDRLQGIKEAVHNKDWQLLDERLAGLGDLSDLIGTVEEVRNSAFLALKKLFGLSEMASIRRVLPYLDFDEREELEHLHRELKIKVIKVKVEYQNLGYYVKNISGFIYRFLEEIFPQTKGNIYSRQGRVSQPHAPSVMVNREL